MRNRPVGFVQKDVFLCDFANLDFLAKSENKEKNGPKIGKK